MILLLVFLLTAPARATDARDLRARLTYRSCQDVLAEVPFDTRGYPIFAWVNEQVRAVDGDGAQGPAMVLHESQRGASPREAFERAFRVDETLAVLAASGPPPFRANVIEPAPWQIEVWESAPKSGDPRAVVLGDRLHYDQASRTVVAGEFVLAVRFDRRNRPRDLGALVALAASRTASGSERLRGLVHFDRSVIEGQLYVTLDIVGDPGHRLREILRLARYINEELRELAIAEPRR